MTFSVHLCGVWIGQLVCRRVGPSKKKSRFVTECNNHSRTHLGGPALRTYPAWRITGVCRALRGGAFWLDLDHGKSTLLPSANMTFGFRRRLRRSRSNGAAGSDGIRPSLATSGNGPLPSRRRPRVPCEGRLRTAGSDSLTQTALFSRVTLSVGGAYKPTPPQTQVQESAASGGRPVNRTTRPGNALRLTERGVSDSWANDVPVGAFRDVSAF